MIESKRAVSLPKRDDHLPQISVTEPDTVSKEPQENSRSAILNPEPKKWDPAKLKEYAAYIRERKEREACALDRLRDLSDEESNNFGVTQQIQLMDADFNTSNVYAKQIDARKSTSSTKRLKRIGALPNTATGVERRLNQEDRINLIQKDDYATSKSSRRVSSEPFEKPSSMPLIKKKPKKVVYPKQIATEFIKKINIGAEILEEGNKNAKRENKTPIEGIERVVTDPDYINLLNPSYPTKEERHHEGITPVNTGNGKGNLRLQVRRLTENHSYISVMNEVHSHNKSGTRKDLRHFSIESGNKSLTNRFGPKKALCLHSKKRTGGNIVMVGRSVSMPKLLVSHPDLTPGVDDERLSIEDSREEDYQTPVHDRNESGNKSSTKKALKELSPISNTKKEKISPVRSNGEKRPLLIKRQNQRASTEEDNRHYESSPIRPLGRMRLQEDRTPKSALDNALKDFPGFKGGFWMKAKKEMGGLQYDKEKSQEDKSFSQNINKSGLDRSLSFSKAKKPKEGVASHLISDILDSNRLRQLSGRPALVGQLGRISNSPDKNERNDTLSRSDIKSKLSKVPKFKGIFNILNKHDDSKVIPIAKSLQKAPIYNLRTSQVPVTNFLPYNQQGSNRLGVSTAR